MLHESMMATSEMEYKDNFCGYKTNLSCTYIYYMRKGIQVQMKKIGLSLMCSTLSQHIEQKKEE